MELEFECSQVDEHFALQYEAVMNEVPIIMGESLLFILEYIAQHEVEDILEVGTAVAYSAISMAQVSPKIKVDTLERYEKYYLIAQENINKANLTGQIKPFFIDAINYETDKLYDIIFIDGAKSQYGNHMRHLENNLRSGGAFIFDNLNFYGLVDAPYPAKTKNVRGIVRKLRNFRQEIMQRKDYALDFHPEIGDGILIAVKN